MGLKPGLPRNRRQLLNYIGALFLVIGGYHLLSGSHHTSSLISSNSLTQPYVGGEKTPHEDPCASLKGLEDVFVIVRTGSNEVGEKIPPLLNTTLPCFRHYGIWSDMEEKFAGLHIADALDEIDPDLLEKHSDFAYYRHLREKGKGGLSEDELSAWADAPNTAFGRDTPAWKLDKWKFLEVASKAYRQHSTSKWYIFLEGDTYIFWTSLLPWLSGIDASRDLYVGRQMNIGSDVFAYGGAGIIISNTAMERLIQQRDSDVKGYNELTLNQWAGDFIMSKVMSDAGIDLSAVWPTLEGEMPSMMDMKTISTNGRHLWCYNAATYHHMTADDIYTYYDFERKWNAENSKFPRHGDIFRELVYPRIKSQISNWDNLSQDVVDEDFSFGQCRDWCEKHDDCIQFSLTGSTCKTMKSVKLGKEHPLTHQSDHVRIDSGWILSRVQSWMEEMESSCNGQDWITP
ncbi:hypothetical protein F5B22DRAFT_287079 [Xylaria bambusicola]|uniref:uncharacterized protein n=1 Tax=Xylaria bambusicola TaxID=326684 RepID=UPI00200845AE|nr:uncharacterized protein F5B22DRAFT_287079 [Xylaria bambusicola]KAI0512854.1 hypothetical protein F5B22DRAFT_287079 [Xylaria bambusicola]